MFTYFTFSQILPLIVSAIIISSSIIAFNLNKQLAGLILLFIGSLFIGFFIAHLDPFLMIWDEQYHALVSKNMIDNPLKPMLYANPILGYDYRNWSGNNIWLHKQPLFLWQIALSLKIVGTSELAIRLPSIILHSLMVVFIYRIGKISYTSTVGFYGALFFSVANYPLELIAGKYSTDHNDVAFLFYVTASFWAWFEYQNSRKSYWIILIGVFSGMAVLVKWLVGLLIFAIWILTISFENKNNWFNFKPYVPFFTSFIISLLVILPWQLFIIYAYPLESKYEFQLNSDHFFHSIENHGGNFWFHFNAIKDLYGSRDIIPFLLLIGLFVFIKNIKENIFRIAIVSAIIIIYLFFSVASTKMTSFCIIVSPFFFIGLGALTNYITNFIQTKIKYKNFELFFKPILLIYFSFLLLNINNIQERHTSKNQNGNIGRQLELNEMKWVHSLPSLLQNEKYVVFDNGNRVNSHIQIMFYTNYIAYHFIPTENQIKQIKGQQFKIAVRKSKDLPDYIIKDKSIVIIEG